MKKARIVLSTILVAAFAITLSSFVAKGFKKNAFAVTCYYFNTSTGKKRVKGTGTDFIDCSQNPKDVLDASKWIVATGFDFTTPPTSANGGDCNDGDYLCAICFDPALISKQDAINLICSFAGTWSQGVNINTALIPVRVYLQSTTANH